MAVREHGVDSIIHVVKRGARGLDIVRDESDKRRFVESLFYLNDAFTDTNWRKNIKGLSLFSRPEHWPDPDPLVHVLAWTLMPNHFHLLLREIREGGIAMFMQRLCGSMSAASNAKYGETGSIFQGPYRSKLVDEDTYLRYLAFYIQVKNVLELRPDGLKRAIAEFNKAWEWAITYSYSSLGCYIRNEDSPVIGDHLLSELFSDCNVFKEEAREMLLTHLEYHDEAYADIALEAW